MDVGTVERGIVIWIDGPGALHYQHEGLTPVQILGLLEMVKHFAFADLVAEQPAEPLPVEALQMYRVE